MIPQGIHVTTAVQLRQRVATFNRCLVAGQESDYWTAMMKSSKYFVYDSQTGLFGLNKFVAYGEAIDHKGARHVDFDIVIYRRIAEPRDSSQFDGGHARKGLEANLGIDYAPAGSLGSARASKLEADFRVWYRQTFGKTPKQVASKLDQAEFIWL